ncbi:hypothetical protein GIB67_030899, partial [Kingdonia uniflora]
MNTTGMTVRILCLRKRLKPITIENHKFGFKHIWHIMKKNIQNGIRRSSIEASLKCK